MISQSFIKRLQKKVLSSKGIEKVRDVVYRKILKKDKNGRIIKRQIPRMITQRTQNSNTNLNRSRISEFDLEEFEREYNELPPNRKNQGLQFAIESLKSESRSHFSDLSICSDESIIEYKIDEAFPVHLMVDTIDSIFSALRRQKYLLSFAKIKVWAAAIKKRKLIISSVNSKPKFEAATSIVSIDDSPFKKTPQNRKTTLDHKTLNFDIEKNHNVTDGKILKKDPKTPRNPSQFVRSNSLKKTTYEEKIPEYFRAGFKNKIKPIHIFLS